jgi:cyclophilin family peptidyl-prolyl cis-trans isomerase
MFAQWKSLLKELRDLQHLFTISEEDQLDTIRQQYLHKLDEGAELVDRLRHTGVQAYAEAPGADPQLTQFLVKLAADDVARDRYEQAWEVCQALMSQEVTDRSLYDVAGTAAYALNEYDLAEKYLKQAQTLGTLEKGQDLLGNLDEMREAWKAEEKIREAEAAADDLPRVKLTTNKGEIVVELFENEAPETVGNFVYLVEQGFYNDKVFHRVLPGFVAQAGCPRGDGTGGPGYRIFCECYRADHRNHFRGSLSMAKAQARDTGGSQFFLAFRPLPHLNGIHTVFGRVIEGMDVLAKLQRRDPDNAEQLAITPDRIVMATVIRKRDHVYEPHKVP